MTKFVICEGCTFIGSEEFVRAYQEEVREAEIERELIAWLDNPANRSDINYSDIYKDVYGIRPRWLYV